MAVVKKLLMLAAGAVAVALLYSAVLLAIGQQPVGREALGWEIAVMFVMGCALVYPIERSRAHGWSLLASVILLAAGVNALLVAFEMLVFTETEGVAPLVLWWICRAAGLSVVLVLSLGKWKPSRDRAAAYVSPHYSVTGWAWRLAVSVLCYTVLFMVAGLLIMQLQAVPDYTSPEYGSQSTTDSVTQDTTAPQPVAEGSTIKVPGLPVIFGFIWSRGLACILFSLPLLRTLSGGRWTAGLSVGLALAVLGGVAPLLAPNPDMTTGARFGHMLEIGWSNVAYGLVIGYFFGNRPATLETIPDQ